MAAAPPKTPQATGPRPATDAAAELRRAETEVQKSPGSWRARKKVVEILESNGVVFDARKAQQHMQKIAVCEDPEAGDCACKWARSNGDVALGCMLLSMGHTSVLEWLALSIDYDNAALVAALRAYAVQHTDVPMLLRLAKHAPAAHLPALLTNMADSATPEEWVVAAEGFAAGLRADGLVDEAAAVYHVLHGLALPEDFEVPQGVMEDAVAHAEDAGGFRDRVRVFAKPLVAAATAGGLVPAAVGLAASIVLRNPADFDAAQFVEAAALDAVDVAAGAIEKLAKGDDAREVFRSAALRFGIVLPQQRASWRCW